MEHKYTNIHENVQSPVSCEGGGGGGGTEYAAYFS